MSAPIVTPAKDGRYERVIDANTGETVLLGNNNPKNFRMTSSNGTTIIDTNENNERIRLLEERQRIRQEERLMAQMQQQQQQPSSEVQKLQEMVGELQKQIAEKTASAAEEKTLAEAKTNEAVPQQETSKQVSTEEMATTENQQQGATYEQFAKFLAQHEEQRAAEKKAEEDKQLAAKAEEERIQNLVKAQLDKIKEEQTKATETEKAAASQKQTESSKRALPELDEEDDASDDDEVASKKKKTTKFNEDVEEIRKLYAAYKEEYDAYKADYDRFLLNKHKIDANTAEKREAKFAKREAKLLAKKDSLMDFTASKFMQYEKESGGATNDGWQGVVADFKSKQMVEPNAMDQLQTQVVAAASTADKFAKQATTLQARERELQEMRKQKELQDLEMKRMKMGLVAKQEADRIDPATRQQNQHATTVATIAQQQQQQPCSTEVKNEEQGYNAYASAGQFVSIASSLERGTEVDDKAMDEYKEQEKRLPIWRQRKSNLSMVPNFGPVGTPGAVLHPVQNLYAGMSMSKHEGHRKVFNGLMRERDAQSGAKGKGLPMVRPHVDYAMESPNMQTYVSQGYGAAPGGVDNRLQAFFGNAQQ